MNSQALKHSWKPNPKINHEKLSPKETSWEDHKMRSKMHESVTVFNEL